MEAQPEEAVITNVLGTLNVCRAAHEFGCESFVLISTDKAVAPGNTMGATKRVGERIVQAFAAESQTVFCAVRFGNVLASRGSVVPIFERQIRQGGPITLTHREMTRFFMTIPEASQLIVQAAELARCGEIFILDMGKPVAIYDLAVRMIRLHGLRPHIDIEIVETGPRPGEKLHEALITDSECLLPTNHPRIMMVQPESGTAASTSELAADIKKIGVLAENHATELLITSLYALANRGSLVSQVQGGPWEASNPAVLASSLAQPVTIATTEHSA
jgi:FlaA1/EpsC-like NDP-sugar epimerase